MLIGFMTAVFSQCCLSVGHAGGSSEDELNLKNRFDLLRRGVDVALIERKRE
jgi:hypothetical protein